jgi:hypothetical protein
MSKRFLTVVLAALMTVAVAGVPQAQGATLSLTVRLDRVVTSTGRGAVGTGAFSTGAGNETLIALVSSDGPSVPRAQSVTVAGAGLSWTLVQRANTALGDAEVWTATAAEVLAGASVTSTPMADGYDQELVVMSFENAGGVGASAIASAGTGKPRVSLTTTAAGSVAYAVGHDWDKAVARRPGSRQSLVQQWVDADIDDTFWVQTLTAPSRASGQAETLNDRAPVDDQWNFAAVELVPADPKTPPDLSQVCPVDLASWTDNGTSVSVRVNPPPGTYVSVSVDASTTLVQWAASPQGALLTFSFAVPGAEVQAVHVRINETGCRVQQTAV